MLGLAAAAHATAEADADAEPGWHGRYGYGKRYGYGYHHAKHVAVAAKHVAVAPKCTTTYEAVTRDVCSTVHESVCTTETTTNFV